MRITYNRKFKSNTGKTYIVENMYKADMERHPGMKYNLSVAVGDRWKICRDPFLEILCFASIKDAQRYVMYNELCIETF